MKRLAGDWRGIVLHHKVGVRLLAHMPRLWPRSRWRVGEGRETLWVHRADVPAWLVKTCGSETLWHNRRRQRGWEGGTPIKLCYFIAGSFCLRVEWELRGSRRGRFGGQGGFFGPCVSQVTVRRKWHVFLSSSAAANQALSRLISITMLNSASYTAHPQLLPPPVCPPLKNKGWWKRAQMHGWELASEKRFGVFIMPPRSARFASWHGNEWPWWWCWAGGREEG